MRGTLAGIIRRALHGFANVIDRNDCEHDRHTRTSAPFVDRVSLIVHATAP
jgi:hypothetical protein